MQPSEFVRKWNEYTTRTGNSEEMRLVPFVSFDPTISRETQQFLAEAGLPAECSFGFNLDFSANLKRVSEVYGWDEKLEPKAYARLHRYIYLGFDGGNSPICLDSKDGKSVVSLHYEAFADPNLAGGFVNSGVAQLAECILIFEEMLEVFRRDNGEETELYRSKVPQLLTEKAMRGMHAADPKIFIKGGYWPRTLLYI